MSNLLNTGQIISKAESISSYKTSFRMEVSKKMNKEAAEKSGDLKDDELYKKFEAQRLQYMHKIATSGTADWDDQLKAYQEMMGEKMKNPEAYDVIANEGKSTTMDATWIEPTPGTDEYKKWVRDGRPRPDAALSPATRAKRAEQNGAQSPPKRRDTGATSFWGGVDFAIHFVAEAQHLQRDCAHDRNAHGATAQRKYAAQQAS